MADSNSSYVMCVLPKAGLGNQLFPLMRAVTFAHIHQLPLKVVGFHQFKIGPYLRREKIKRKYRGYFKLEKSIIKEWCSRIYFKYFNRLPIEVEPKQDRSIDKTTEKVYLFNSFDYRDYFYYLKEHRELVVSLFWDILSEDVKEELKTHQTPFIGVHIRRGDFKEIWRTSDDYFINIIRSIREVAGENLPVSIFTDGYAYELKNILSLPNVNLIEGNRDIVDLLLLSKSKVIVVSSGSTFGFWASFLSEVPLIVPQDHFDKHSPVREDVQKLFFEGVFDASNEFLLQQLKQVF